MITDTYNRKAEIIIADNGAVIQGELSKRSMVSANHVANSNQPPALPQQQAFQQSERTTSFSKSLDKENDDNPITQEALSDGLGALFGAATGLDGIEMFIDYACDAVEFYDEIMMDRNGNPIAPPAYQIDPRIWAQPQPGMSMAA